jgi:predicted ATPase
MRLVRLRARRYKSINEDSITFGSLNLLIGANASGKSNILDVLRFLSEGIRRKEFAASVNDRGGIIHLAWKGEEAKEIDLETTFESGDRTYDWRVTLVRSEYDFSVRESLDERRPTGPPNLLLSATDGKGWWWSEAVSRRLHLELPPAACALAAAAADATFPARSISEFANGWRFFDPSPALLRRASTRTEVSTLDSSGANLAARLKTLKERSPEVFDRILGATRSVLGVPDEIIFRDSGDRVYAVFSEPGLAFTVHQVGASSGTLRTLALMTALFGEAGTTLVGIEEPENHVHPSALAAFTEHLRNASKEVQIIVSTHSPVLLNYLGEPEAVCFVRRTQTGTKVERERNAEAVRRALDQSGFGLGEFYETKGFGA